jgi:hypothetical protein
VASLRHGNGFPLVNKALLDRASITGRRTPDKDLHEIDLASRIIALYITYIVSATSRLSVSHSVLFSQVTAVVELAILTGASTLCLRYGLTTGAVPPVSRDQQHSTITATAYYESHLRK